MILLPRGCWTIRARTAASGTIGVPIAGVSPPIASTSLNSTSAPTSPAIRSTVIWSPTPTRYCFPPVLTMANIRLIRTFLATGRGKPCQTCVCPQALITASFIYAQRLVSRERRALLVKTQAFAAFRRDHLGGPRRIPDQVNVCLTDAWKREQFLTRVDCNGSTHSAALGRERHLNIHPLRAPIQRHHFHRVNQSQV